MAKVMKVISTELYNQLISTAFATKINKSDSIVDTAEKKHINEEQILESIAPRQKENAKRLLSFLTNFCGLSWNDSGEIIVNNQRSPFSNIIDLISLCISENKETGDNEKLSIPGLNEVVNILKANNCAKILVSKWFNENFLLPKEQTINIVNNESEFDDNADNDAKVNVSECKWIKYEDIV